MPTEPEDRGYFAAFFVGWLGEEHAASLLEGSRAWSSHTLMACVFLAGIWIVEKFCYLLWGKDLPILFGWFPFQWLFHAADAGVVGSFLFYGGYRALRAYMGRR